MAGCALTIEQFCAKQGFVRSKFHAWKRRFRLADAASQCSTLPARGRKGDATGSVEKRGCRQRIMMLWATVIKRRSRQHAWNEQWRVA